MSKETSHYSSALKLLGELQAEEIRERLEENAREREALQILNRTALRLEKPKKPKIPLAFGPWVALRDLREGAIFETKDRGVRAVKSEYTYDGQGVCQCVLLESGEYVHFLHQNDEIVREIILPKREE